MHDLMNVAMISAMVASVAVVLVLWSRVSQSDLLAWCAMRMAVCLARMWHSHRCVQGRWRQGSEGVRTYVMLALIDGLSWGAMGWWLTPVARLDVAVVSLTTAVAVAAVGVLGLHVFAPATVVFVCPILLPNAVYALGRHDDLGLFCCAGLLGYAGLLMMELGRCNRRILEMLRLRFESEQVVQAKNEALRQAHELAELRSRIVATMSHEMRTPLHGILGLARMVHEDVEHPRALRHLALMKHSGEHLISVINEVLDYARLESQTWSLSIEPFKLSSLLIDLTDVVRISAQDKGLSLTLVSELPPDELVMGDATRIRQVLHNLLGNAVKFTDLGGITLTATRRSGSSQVVLSVTDTGSGISPAEVERIFDPFHQAEGTYSRRHGGTGLGLTISRELCETMGGHLVCRSQLGQGSTFECELSLPPCQGLAPAEHPQVDIKRDDVAHDAAHGLAHLRVLLVEDNPVNTLVAEAELHRLGVQVTAVDSGAAALAWLQHHAADLILMDCEMPDMDGIAATREIRRREHQARRQPVPVIAMTANGRDTYADRCAPAGMTDYLSKPFTGADLEAMLRRHAPSAGTGHVASLREPAAPAEWSQERATAPACQCS